MVIRAVPNCFERTRKRGKKWRENRYGKVTFHRIPERGKNYSTVRLRENAVPQVSHKNTDFPMEEESGQKFVQHGIEESCLNNTEVCTLHENGNVSEEAERESVLHVQGAFNPSILEVIITEDSYKFI
ncbi:uncharacterized protein LOC117174762 isoform X2 [Belonocnema kinseyi]|uniref:uncharacterized protein LOC117174762 isoform X2 n=1 Tax=Belonocnema kinseyi TaxID=2817044 RepID=UPI00143D043E|nr:uncharacterized protein LOC117174762 isoform X2 [Belonocnema kinseyi]